MHDVTMILKNKDGLFHVFFFVILIISIIFHNGGAELNFSRDDKQIFGVPTIRCK